MKENSVTHSIKRAHHKNSHAKTSNVFAHNIDVTVKMIAAIILMKWVVRRRRIVPVLRDNLRAPMDNVSRIRSFLDREMRWFSNFFVIFSMTLINRKFSLPIPGIDYQLVCNKQIDCSDESDEPAHCNVDECAKVEIHQCGHKCVDTLTSYYCDCNQGYK